MKYGPIDEKEAQEDSHGDLGVTTEVDSYPLTSASKSGFFGNIREILFSVQGKKLKVIGMTLASLIAVILVLAVALHYKHKYYGNDSAYESFRKYYTDRGKDMVDALPNGTYELHPFKPSAFDKEYGLDYSVKELCSNTKWHKDLYLSCSPIGNWGGLWNNHNEVLGCFRRAIDAGLGIVIPSIIPRSKKFLLGWELDNPQPFDYLFDTDNMKKKFAEYCPQLKLKDYIYKFPNTINITNTFPPLNFGEFKDHFDNFVKETGFDLNNHPETQFVHEASTSAWNFRDNGFTIHKQFYDILKMTNRNDNLTAPILAKLPERFIGFHLRQEYDMVRVTFEGLTGWFLKLVTEHFPDIKTIYVAVGTDEMETKFRDFMKPLGYTILSKWSLVADNPAVTEGLKNLRFDELGIVEYQVLMKATQFYGVTTSTLSWATALLRGDFDMGKCRCELYEGNLADIEVSY